MKKIISLFQRNYETDRLVRDEVVPGAEWVLAGEGVPTRKFDGTACAIINGSVYKRYNLKKGKQIPEGAIACMDKPDPNTGHFFFWVPVKAGEPEDKYFLEAFGVGKDYYGNDLIDGTYELCGTKVQGNAEAINGHILVPHGKEVLENVPRTFDGIKEYLRNKNIEGIVWWHPDGRMVKIKKKDFGLRRIQNVT